MSKFCTKCGYELPDNANECPKCGSSQAGGDPEVLNIPGIIGFGAAVINWILALAAKGGIVLPLILILVAIICGAIGLGKKYYNLRVLAGAAIWLTVLLILFVVLALLGLMGDGW